jgi:hypothetical protein
MISVRVGRRDVGSKSEHSENRKQVDQFHGLSPSIKAVA